MTKGENLKTPFTRNYRHCVVWHALTPPLTAPKATVRSSDLNARFWVRMLRTYDTEVTADR